VAKWSWKWIGPDWNRLKQIEMDNGWKWRLCPGMLVWLSFNLFARSRQNMLGRRCRSIPSPKILPISAIWLLYIVWYHHNPGKSWYLNHLASLEPLSFAKCSATLVYCHSVITCHCLTSHL
jgi:hypothetical protein